MIYSSQAGKACVGAEGEETEGGEVSRVPH